MNKVVWTLAAVFGMAFLGATLLNADLIGKSRKTLGASVLRDKYHADSARYPGDGDHPRHRRLVLPGPAPGRDRRGAESRLRGAGVPLSQFRPGRGRAVFRDRPAGQGRRTGDVHAPQRPGRRPGREGGQERRGVHPGGHRCSGRQPRQLHRVRLAPPGAGGRQADMHGPGGGRPHRGDAARHRHRQRARRADLPRGGGGDQGLSGRRRHRGQADPAGGAVRGGGRLLHAARPPRHQRPCSAPAPATRSGRRRWWWT